MRAWACGGSASGATSDMAGQPSGRGPGTGSPAIRRPREPGRGTSRPSAPLASDGRPDRALPALPLDADLHLVTRLVGPHDLPEALVGRDLLPVDGQDHVTLAEARAIGPAAGGDVHDERTLLGPDAELGAHRGLDGAQRDRAH